VKLLFDQNISFRVINLIHDLFPDARHVKDFDLQFSSERQIWNFAKENGYHIVTFDSDFYDLVTLFGHPPKIIWLRLGNTSSSNLSVAFSHHYESIKSFLEDEQFKEIACLEIDQ
jgi:predicted nuclease of predicted toxin-antitoxin system